MYDFKQNSKTAELKGFPTIVYLYRYKLSKTLFTVLYMSIEYD